MAHVVKIKGRIIKSFNGELVDKETGEVQNFQESVTVLDDESFEQFKVKVTPEQFKAFGDKMGQVINVQGVIVKPASAAELQGTISEIKR